MAGLLSVSGYASLLSALLPRGRAFPRAQGSVQTRTLEGLAAELARVDTRLGDALTELLPATADELLEEWERVLGLPGPCLGPAPDLSDDQRRAMVKELLTRIGGMAPAFYVAQAARLGFTVSVVEFRPLDAGSECTAELTQEADWAAADSAAGCEIYTEGWRFAWRVDVEEATLIDVADCTDPCDVELRSWGEPVLECTLRGMAPAHTWVFFAYLNAEEEEP